MEKTDDRTEIHEPPPAPWWRFPLVWMVIAGPACVVVAGFATLWIAIAVPDPVIAPDRSVASRAQVPALIGRNHAATPGDAMPAPPPRKFSRVPD